MEQTDPRDLLVQIAKILDNLKISYIVSGGMAVFVWGRPRFTADIDIVIEIKETNLMRLQSALQALGEAGYIDINMMKDALKNHREFNFIDGVTGVKVDFYIVKKDNFSISCFKRGRKKEIAGYKVNFISPEDLILIKLKWHKESGSTKQLEDAESILKISEDILDMEYLNVWTEKLEVREIFDNILKK